MKADMSGEKLRQCLAAIPKLELKGTVLMQQCGFPGWSAIVSGEKLREAVLESVQYSNRCQYGAQRLAKLPAIVQQTVVYGL